MIIWEFLRANLAGVAFFAVLFAALAVWSKQRTAEPAPARRTLDDLRRNARGTAESLQRASNMRRSMSSVAFEEQVAKLRQLSSQGALPQDCGYSWKQIEELRAEMSRLREIEAADAVRARESLANPVVRRTYVPRAASIAPQPVTRVALVRQTLRPGINDLIEENDGTLRTNRRARTISN